MEVQKTKPKTFDQLAFERSNSFVNALQELKNLRPQLYSAAEYCEKSYLIYSEQKPMVFINLKDYAARAVVNAVDHLGTVAYKLCDLLEHQSLDISAMESKFTRLNQQFLTLQMYAVKEGLRQHQLVAIIQRRHHKHYTTLPNSVNKKVQFSPQIEMEPGKHIQASSSGTLATNYVSRDLTPSQTKSTLKEALCAFTSSEYIKGAERGSGASETKSTLKEALRAFTSCEEIKCSGRESGTGKPNMLVLLADPPRESVNVDSASSVTMQALGLLGRIMCACVIHDTLA